LGVPGKEIQTLIQCHRMRKNALDLGKLHALAGDQIVDDAHAGFGHDGQFEVHQVVIVLVDAAGERVLDRHHRAGRPAVL
jgi:hypothetical protein